MTLARSLLALAALALGLCAAPAAHATPGDLDVDFGGTGTVAFNIKGALGPLDLADVRIDGSERVIVTGTADLSRQQVLIARLLPDGGFDSTFAPSSAVGAGRALIAFDTDTQSYALAQLPSGHIVSGGDDDSTGFALAILNFNGVVDSTILHPAVAFGMGDDKGGNIHGMVVQSDGKLVAAGSAGLGGGAAIALARVNPDGTLDTSFSFDGKVVEEVPGATQSAELGLACAQPSGSPDRCAPGSKLLVAAEAIIGGTVRIALERFNTDGTLDRTFAGGSGAAILGPVRQQNGNATFFTVNGGAGDLTVDTSGRPIVGDGRDIERLTSAGALDTSFASGGDIALESTARLRALTETPQGGVLALVRTGATTMELRRYEPNGSPDTSFGGGNGVTSMPPSVFGEAVRIADGKILVAGGMSDGSGRGAVTRFLDVALVGTPVVTPSTLSTTINVQLVTATSVGILVQRRVHGRLVTVGRVPFGRKHKGRNRIRWNHRVNGRRLRPGIYFIRVRLLDSHGHVFEVSKPFRIRVGAPRRGR